MRVIIERDAGAVALGAASRVADLIRRSSGCVLGLPTGSTPLPFYCELVRLHREEGLSFARVVSFNLDEYVGLPPDHPASFARYMDRELFDHVGIDPANTHRLDGNAEDLEAACDDYEDAIRDAGGIDLVILGIGVNGHIGFNEPGSSFDSRTRVTTLTPETLEANAAAFGGPEEVPRLGITIGVGTILEARTCLLLATGEHKAAAVRDTIEGPVTPQVPASALQLHPEAIVMLDEPAASRLRHRDDSGERDVAGDRGRGEARRRAEAAEPDATCG